MDASPPVVILGGALITTEIVLGSWMQQECAFKGLRDGGFERVVVFDGGLPGPVFSVFDGTERLVIRGGFPAVYVQCGRPGDLTSTGDFEERLAREGLERIDGLQIWRWDRVAGFTGLIQIDSSPLTAGCWSGRAEDNSDYAG